MTIQTSIPEKDALSDGVVASNMKAEQFVTRSSG